MVCWWEFNTQYWIKQRSMKVRLIVVVAVLLCTVSYPQIVNKVLVSGYGGSHDENVKSAFEIGYSSHNGSIFPGTIEIYSYSISTSFQYAEDNNFEMVLRSTTGLSTAIEHANNYPSVKLVMPSGSNSFVQTYDGDIETCPVIVCGAGTSDNVTGYKIDFYSVDPIYNNNYSSFSTGYIAGQIAFIANNLNISIENARQIARDNGSQGGVFDTYNGYGKIDIQSSITTPFPVELTSFSGKLINKTVILNWETATELNNYGFEIERASFREDGTTPDNAEWKTIGFVEGHGNSSSPKNYSFIDTNIPTGNVNVSYRLKQIDTDGTFELSELINIKLEEPNSSQQIVLKQNYPNPFGASVSAGNTNTTIKYTIAQKGFISLTVYNILGEEVRTLVNKEQAPGSYDVQFSPFLRGEELPSGIYIAKIISGNFSKNIKMIFLR